MQLITNRCPSCAAIYNCIPGKTEGTCLSCGHIIYETVDYDQKPQFIYNKADYHKLQYDEKDGQLTQLPPEKKSPRASIKGKDKKKFQSYIDKKYDEKGIKKMTCPSCGAEINDTGEISGICPYCNGNFYIPFESCDNNLVPKIVIPFHVNREKATRIFRKWNLLNFWRLFFFMNIRYENQKKIVPGYVPVFLFSAETSTDYKGEKGTADGDGSTKWEKVSGNTKVNYTDLPVATYNAREDKYTSWYLDWEPEKAKNFNPGYVSGINMRCFGKNETDILEPAGKRFYDSLEWWIKKKIGGEKQKIHSRKTEFSNVTSTAALVPVWKARTEHNGKPVWCLINGQSGKVIGRGPEPKRKYINIVSIILAVLFLATGLANMFNENNFNYERGVVTLCVAVLSSFFFRMGLTKYSAIGESLLFAVAPVLVLIPFIVFRFELLYCYLWLGIGVLGFYGLVYLLYLISYSDDFDETIFSESDLMAVS